MSNKFLVILFSFILVVSLLAACGPTVTPVPTEPPPTTQPAAAPVSASDVVGITWQWAELTETEPAGQSVVADPENYTLALMPDGTANVKADCNRVSWPYTLEGNVLTFDALFATTLAACPPGSLYDQYLKLLGNGGTVALENGRLVLELNDDAGRMIFEATATGPGGGVGIDPGSVSIDTMGLPYSWQANLVPATPYDASQPPGPRGLPEHIQINFGGDPTARQHPDERQPGDPVLYIIPVEAYKNMYLENGDQSVASTVDMQLEMLLDPPEGLPKNGMPVLPFEEVTGYNDLATQGTYLDSGTSKGLRFVGRFAQDANPVINEGLRYIYQGYTGDVSEYLIAFFYPVTTDALPSSMEEVPANEQASATEDPEPYLDEKGEMLNGLAASDWEPDLTLLDSVIGSLKFETSASDRDLLGHWYWLRSTYNNDTELIVDVPSRYIVDFKADGTLGIRADCNQLSWTYSREDGSLAIDASGPATLAQCPQGSLDREFLKDLSEVAGYVMHEGNLVLNIRADVGNMIFGK